MVPFSGTTSQHICVTDQSARVDIGPALDRLHFHVGAFAFADQPLTENETVRRYAAGLGLPVSACYRDDCDVLKWAPLHVTLDAAISAATVHVTLTGAWWFVARLADGFIVRRLDAVEHYARVCRFDVETDVVATVGVPA